MTQPPSLKDRILGCLLAGAVGDALGAPIEFMTLADIRHMHGTRGLREPILDARGLARITDDTQLTLFTAEGLLRAAVPAAGRTPGGVPAVVRRAYLRWLHTQGGTAPDLETALLDGWLVTERRLFERRAPGITCLAALGSGRFGAPDQPLNDSKGCGGVMRIAPAGLVARVFDPASSGDAASAAEMAFTLGDELAALTHGHPTGWLASGALAAIIALLVEGLELGAALDAVTVMLARHPDSLETLRAIEKARVNALKGCPTSEDLEALGGGWIAEEALGIALYCVLAEHDPQKALTLSVNHGGDSDSTGAITGNLLGTLRGPGFLPDSWLDHLELRDVIETVALDLAALAEGRLDLGAKETLLRYPG